MSDWTLEIHEADLAGAVARVRELEHELRAVDLALLAERAPAGRSLTRAGRIRALGDRARAAERRVT